MKILKLTLLFFPILFQAQIKKVKVGDYYQGGIVFHITNDSLTQHGLIVSINDIAKETTWSNVTMELVNENLNYEKDGEKSTQEIINQKNHTNSAAYLCSKYKHNGFSGWYLPSLNEFVLLFNNKDIIEHSLKKNKGELLDNKLYWTSNEYMYGFAWVFPYYFSSKQSYEVDKVNLYPVRAVKKF